MKDFVLYILIVLLAAPFASCNAQSSSSSKTYKVEKDEMAKIKGDWIGSLTYLDYTSKKPFSMPCNVTLSNGRNKSKFKIKYVYPNEPKANRNGRVKFTKRGTYVNKQKIKSKITNAQGNLEIHTEYSSKDGNDNQEALMRNTYVLGPDNLLFRKDVKFKNSDEWIMRNEYSFKRK